MTPHYPARAPIDAFGRGGFRFAHLSHRGSLLVLPSGMYSWVPASLAKLAFSDFELLLKERGAFDWLLLGTGSAMARPPAALLTAFAEQKVPLDYMSTPAAVRTYNVVLAEGRRVAAALIAVGDSHGA